MVVCSGIAYGFIPFNSCAAELPSCKKVASGVECCTKADNMGWRYLMFTLGAISLFVFILRFVVFTFQESPKYLLGKGKDEEALMVLHNVARINRKECHITMETFAALTTDNDSETTDNSGTPILELPGGVNANNSTIMEKVKFEFVRLKILFSSATMVRITILVWIIYAFDYWGFSVAGENTMTLSLSYH